MRRVPTLLAILGLLAVLLLGSTIGLAVMLHSSYENLSKKDEELLSVLCEFAETRLELKDEQHVRKMFEETCVFLRQRLREHSRDVNGNGTAQNQPRGIPEPPTAIDKDNDEPPPENGD